MYRIMIARNGYYYVQAEWRSYWTRCSGFFATKEDARDFVRRIPGNCCTPRRPPSAQVVEYL